MSDSYSTGIRQFVLDRDEAARKAVGYIESSPDDAARALELEQATGVNSSAIAGDLEGFERQTKARMAGDIVQNNNHVADYINSHPLAAQLSSDDLGNLDAVSEKLKPLNIPILSAPANIGNRAMSGFGRGFVEGFGNQSLGTWAYDPENVDYSKQVNRASWAAWSVLGAVPEVGFRFLSGMLKGGIEAGLSRVWRVRGRSQVLRACGRWRRGDAHYRPASLHAGSPA